MFRRFDLKTEIELAIIPTVVIIIVLLLLEAFSKQQLLFSSLASSGFLIYLDPKPPTNRVRTLIIGQMSAAIIGFIVFFLMGPGYDSASVSMIIAIGVMILSKAMYSLAVSSALLFAFEYKEIDILFLFLMAVMLLVILIMLQRVSLWLI